MLERLNLDGILRSLEVSRLQLENDATSILLKIKNTKAVSSPLKAVPLARPLASHSTTAPAPEDEKEIWHDFSDIELQQLEKLEDECEKEKEVAQKDKVDDVSEEAKNKTGEEVAEKDIVEGNGEQGKGEEVAEQEKDKQVSEKDKVDEGGEQAKNKKGEGVGQKQIVEDEAKNEKQKEVAGKEIVGGGNAQAGNMKGNENDGKGAQINVKCKGGKGGKGSKVKGVKGEQGVPVTSAKRTSDDKGCEEKNVH